MRRRLSLAALFVALAAPTSWAASFNLATGLDASGNLISTGGVDVAGWTVTVDPTFSPTGIPQTVFPNNADWYGGWLANGPNSDWIARNANVSDNGPAPYTFTYTFTLTSDQVSSAAITGGAGAIDDTGTLSLNGNTLSTLGSGAWGSLTPFAVPSTDFVVGTNTLTMTLTSDDRFLEAARLQGTLTFASVPEPSTMIMGATALMIGAAAIHRRRKSVARAS